MFKQVVDMEDSPQNYIYKGNKGDTLSIEEYLAMESVFSHECGLLHFVRQAYGINDEAILVAKIKQLPSDCPYTAFFELPLDLQTKLWPLPARLQHHDYQLLREVMSTGNLTVLQWLNRKYNLTLAAFRSDRRSGMWSIKEKNHSSVKEWLDATFQLNGKDRHALGFHPERMYKAKYVRDLKETLKKLNSVTQPQQSGEPFLYENDIPSDKLQRIMLNSAIQERSFDYLKDASHNWTCIGPQLPNLLLSQEDILLIFALALQEGHLDCLDWIITFQPITRTELLQNATLMSSIQIAINHDRCEVLQWLYDAFEFDFVDYGHFQFANSCMGACQQWIFSHFNNWVPN